MSNSVTIDAVATKRPAGKQGGAASVKVESPLAHIRFQSQAQGGVVFEELALHGHLTLRGNVANEEFVKGVESVLGMSLPTDPLTSSTAGERSIHWVGPSEWLILLPSGEEADVEEQLRNTLTGHFQVVDVSGGQTLFRLSGDDAIMVLKKSCGYDVEGELPVGKSVTTHFSKVTVLLHRQDTNAYLMTVRRSFADYAWRWLEDAAQEYGLVVKGV